jgi:diguanylate cyclase (GGDEF)-like protein
MWPPRWQTNTHRPRIWRFPSMGLRIRFMLAPLIGVLLLMVVIVLVRIASHQQDEALRHIGAERTARLVELSHYAVELSEFHLGLFSLIDQDVPTLDEEQLYERAIGMLDRLHEEVSQFPQRMSAYGGELACVQAQQIGLLLQHYYKQAFQAVDLSTVDLSRARSRLRMASREYIEAKLLIQQCLNSERNLLLNELHINQQQNQQQQQWLSWLGGVIVLGMLLLSWCLAHWLSSALIQQIRALHELSCAASGDLMVAYDEGGEELHALSQAVTIFRASLCCLKASEQALLQVHIELQQSHQDLELRVAQSTEALRDNLLQLQHQEIVLARQAMHDTLTDLPNRALLYDHIAQAITEARRCQQSFAVMFIDLDKFKLINDTQGHAEGDVVLQIIAARLKECVRGSDTVARLGGDEFVLLVTTPMDAPNMSHLALRVLQVIRAPMQAAAQTHTLSGSIGICVYPQDGEDAEQLLKHADIAMYRAKDAGRGSFCFFTAQMQAALDERLRLEHCLDCALREQEFVLYFQPKFDLSNGRLVSAEALIRWQSSCLGFMGPDQFIPIAEESQLILAIGEWVIRRTCLHLAQWRQAGLSLVPVAVNVAAPQITGQRVDQLFRVALDEHALEAQWLEVEITESLSMADPDATIVWMNTLAAMGISLAIDDFGTGYSNLSYLHQFPVDILKIDRAFVMPLTRDGPSREITRAIINLAHALNLRCVAEGVETSEQLALLREDGCDYAQGYFFSPPLPEAAFMALLKTQDALSLSITQDGFGSVPADTST